MQQDWLLMTAPKLAFEGSLTLTPLASQPVRAGELLYGFGWGGHAQEFAILAQGSNLPSDGGGTQVDAGLRLLQGRLRRPNRKEN